ncbi:hypothetical protein LshimejAT787_0102960 [Lyophyllum shimeji]|uniref:Uncharacterized protein n=1 Tax=Lyophyllum shimeji TaxID=47721 RepID=A0A9P3PCQ9_LYOSH|nr:hypothetical protein LshimejAT787_0102960 [Lyophyllum shimeji]
MDEEAQLAAHIRDLLLDYVRCHITIDYMQFTRAAVAELISLEQVPEHDPASLTLPTDPFTALFNQVGNLPPYQEKVVISQAARLLLKNVISLPKGKPRSERLSWSKDAWDQREEDAFYNVDPIVTRRAVRETPVLGKSGGARRSAMRTVDFKSYSSLLTSIPIAITPIEVQPVQEPKVNLDQVLDVIYHLKASDHSAVRAFLKSGSTSCRPQTRRPNASNNDYRRLYLPASFDFDQPRPITPPPDSPPLVPIFTRKDRDREKCLSAIKAGRGVHRAPLRSMGEIPDYIGASGMHLPGSDYGGVIASAESLSRENMIIVDGWQTYATSSPSTICSADSDGIDELIDMFPSSPDTSVVGALNLVRDVEDSKLEEVQIPRNRRFGGSLGQEKMKAGGLGAFLAPLLSSSTFDSKNVHIQNVHPLLQPKLAPVLRRTPSEGGSSAEKKVAQSLEQPVASPRLLNRKTEADMVSLCGQASASSISALEIAADGTKEEDNEDDEIRRLYRGLPAADENRLAPLLPRIYPDPKALIRDERLLDDDSEMEENNGGQKDTDREMAMMLRLMPVPLLPQPNANAKARVKGYSEYLVESATEPGASGEAASNATKSDKDVPALPRFLKGVKGIAPLRVALSWTPFTRTKPMPAHARILGNDLFQEMEGGEVLEREVHALLASVSTDPEGDPGDPGGRGVGDEWRWRGVGAGAGAGAGGSAVLQGDHEFSPEIAKCEIILTRAERRALAAREGGRTTIEQGEKEDDTDYDGEQAPPDHKHFDDHASESLNARKLTAACDESEYRPAKRPRRSIEDSGVGMISDAAIQDETRLDLSDRQNNVLEYRDLGVQDRTNDMLRRIYADDDEMLTRSSYDCYEDDNKENDPPARTMVEWTDHSFCIDEMSSDAQQLTLDRPMVPVEETLRLGRELADWNYDYDDDAGGSFEPLSLSYDSQPYQMPVPCHRQPAGTNVTRFHEDRELYQEQQGKDAYGTVDVLQGTQERSGQHWTQPRCVLGDVAPADGCHDANMSTNADDPDMRPAEARTGQFEQAPCRETESLGLRLATYTFGISDFAKLRAKKLAPDTSLSTPSALSDQVPGKTASGLPPGAEQERVPSEIVSLKTAPQEVYDNKTLHLPSRWKIPINVHKYMASLDVIQKQVLVRALASQEFLVDLVERESLDGADLIIDPHTAVLFISLLSLPAHNKKLLGTLSAQTWRYKRVLVVFEAYPSSRSYKSASGLRQKQGHARTEPELNAYTPPIVKAIKKFRRDLNIAEGCGKKAAGCEVWWAFADSNGRIAPEARHGARGSGWTMMYSRTTRT